MTIDGRVAVLGDRAGPTQAIAIDGRPAETADTGAPGLDLLYHKPVGEICTRSDPEGRPTIFDNLDEPRRGRLVAVGRLDLNTSGLLILTTDGEFANAMMHPKNALERRYRVRVNGRPHAGELQQLRDGIDLSDGRARFDRVTAGRAGRRNQWFEVTLREGRNREVRRLWEALGYRVSRLIRTAYGGVLLPRDLPAGHSRKLTATEVATLRNAL